MGPSTSESRLSTLNFLNGRPPGPGTCQQFCYTFCVHKLPVVSCSCLSLPTKDHRQPLTALVGAFSLKSHAMIPLLCMTWTHGTNLWNFELHAPRSVLQLESQTLHAPFGRRSGPSPLGDFSISAFRQAVLHAPRSTLSTRCSRANNPKNCATNRFRAQPRVLSRRRTPANFLLYVRSI